MWYNSPPNRGGSVNIQIGKLEITSFCEENPKHKLFKRDLMDDKFMGYFLPDIQEKDFLRPCETQNQIQIGNYYIAKEKDNLVGWFFLKGSNRSCALDCGVQPHFRKNGYGTLILQEYRDYFFKENIVDEIELVIKNTNAGAINCAKKAKYKQLGRFDDFYIYSALKI